MPLKLDPTKIKTRIGLAVVIVLVFESLFLLWFTNAENSYERIAAGFFATVILGIFIRLTIDKENQEIPLLDQNSEKIVGKWSINSISSNKTAGTGVLNISIANNILNIAGHLEVNGQRLGSFHSEVTRVNFNRLIFYYILRDTINNENMDAVAILYFDPENPEVMEGDWIVASRNSRPRHGNLTLYQIKA